jgi:hypothetical protein
MCPVIDNPASCETRTVILFPHATNMSAAKSHHELCMVVYGQNVMSVGTVRKLCRRSKDEQVNKCSR